jgi:hypothetical protein
LQYSTIMLELLEQRPQLHERLRSERMLLPALNLYSSELKARHEAWKEQLSQARPGSDASQIASQALEIAVKEMEDSLPSASPEDGSEALSLDQAIAYICLHMPPA